jgi:hypothetical protein
MRQTTDSMLEDLRITGQECDVSNLDSQAKTKLDEKVSEINDSIDAAFDALRAALDERRNKLKDELNVYNDGKRKDIDNKVRMLKTSLAENVELCDVSRGMLMQSEMIPIQQDCKNHKQTTSKLKDDVTTLDDVNLALAYDDLRQNIKGLGKLERTQGVALRSVPGSWKLFETRTTQNPKGKPASMQQHRYMPTCSLVFNVPSKKNYLHHII